MLNQRRRNEPIGSEGVIDPYPCRKSAGARSHVNHTRGHRCWQVIDPTSRAGSLTWVRFPSPAPLSRQAEKASAGSSQSVSRELRLDRAVVPGLHSVPHWLLPSGAGSGFTRGRRLPRFACGRIRILEADVRDRVLSANSSHLAPVPKAVIPSRNREGTLFRPSDLLHVQALSNRDVLFAAEHIPLSV